MRSLLNLITEHSEANSMIPIIAMAAVIFTIIIYVILKPKWIKYLLSIAVIVVGGVILYNGYLDLIQPSGLDDVTLGTKVLVFGIVSFLFSIILDILDSMANMFKRKKINKKKDEQVEDKTTVIPGPEASVKAELVSEDQTKVIPVVDSQKLEDDTIVIKGPKADVTATIVDEKGQTKVVSEVKKSHFENSDLDETRVMPPLNKDVSDDTIVVKGPKADVVTEIDENLDHTKIIDTKNIRQEK